MMIKNGGGTIINIASTAGITGVPRTPAYCASKAGVILPSCILQSSLNYALTAVRLTPIEIVVIYQDGPLQRGIQEFRISIALGKEKEADFLSIDLLVFLKAVKIAAAF